MRIKVGDLVRVIAARDQSLWELSHIGKTGLLVEITYLTSRPRYKVLIEDHFVFFHGVDLVPLTDEMSYDK